ncbi:MAG: ACP S-malonyltransferase [Firmicutes bacterium]|nr:ACP S-malonyltransferase [Bacillota bacterium]
MEGGEGMTHWAVMFPGQGSQYVGMGKALYRDYSVAKLAFEEANEALDIDLSSLIFEGPDSALEDTEIQQPAILVVSVAAWRALKDERPEFLPDAALGLSLGEYSAYVASGVLPYVDAVRITRLRGRAMQSAVPKGEGGMMAVLGLASDVVEDICREASRVGTVDPANFNAPGQVVVSGLEGGLARVGELVRAQGGKAVRLAVSAPFHSRLLAPAGAVLEDALNEIRWGAARFPVIANVDAEPCREAEEIVPRLVAQVSRPVRFEDSIRRLAREGVTHFLELGPGKSLTSLVKKIDRSLQPLAVQDSEGLRKALELV